MMRAARQAYFGAAKRASYAWGHAKAWLLMTLLSDRFGRLPLFIGRAPKLVVRGTWTVGVDFRMRSGVARSLVEIGPEGVLEIGDHVFINQGTVIAAMHSVSIGNRVDIGDAVRIYDSNFHPVTPGGETKTLPVAIEDDVWVASGAMILPGVRIGRGSVVAAGAIVTKSVPSGAVVAGNPAQIVGEFPVPSDYRRRGRFVD